jgi:hypothetical protein
MELNRNQFFFLGLVILLIGLQFRVVESYTLNEEATKILAEKLHRPVQGQTLSLATSSTGARKVIVLPDWAGWFSLALGSVLILHSLAMPKPGG